jgi:hypothetical protein
MVAVGNLEPYFTPDTDGTTLTKKDQRSASSVDKRKRPSSQGKTRKREKESEAPSQMDAETKSTPV